MNGDDQLALFLMLGQGAARTVKSLKEVAPPESLWLASSYDLGPLLPDAVRQSLLAAEAYQLFFVFETYLRELGRRCPIEGHRDELVGQSAAERAG